jgi:predicted CoA-binding protein
MDENTFKKYLDKKNKIGFIGATIQKDKWGYKKYKELKIAGYSVYPINPRYKEIDGDRCFSDLKELIEFLNKKPDYIITIVPPIVTEKVVEQCKDYGIDKIWMQPGSESEKAIEFCKENGIEVVSGVCIVVDALQKL